MKKICIKYKNWKAKNEKQKVSIAQDDYCFMMSKNENENGILVVDSGATSHMMNSIKNFIDLGINVK